MEEKINKSKEMLKDFQNVINPVLNEILDSHISSLKSDDSNYSNFIMQFAKFIREQINNPAKRVRPAFVYYAYLLNNPNASQDEIKNVLRIAAAVEIIHTALLFHDDVMDQDTVRRGKNTFHNALKLEHEEKNLYGNSTHYGYSQAISAGDIALTLGYSMILETTFVDNRNLEVLKNVFSNIIPTGYGQGFDMFLESMERVDEEDILRLHEQKTALYTYLNPIMSGLILSSADEHTVSVFSEYSKFGGIAFQLQDDALGLFGDPEKTGKSDFADLKEGKHTILTEYVLNYAEKNEKETFLGIWRNHEITQEDAEVARNIVRNCGALAYSNKLAKSYAEKSIEALALLENVKNQEVLDFFEGISLYMATERTV